jgi:RimJ/RimL family protein N-acetyltransferase
MARPVVTLRTMTTADLPAVAPWFTDPDTQRYLGGPEWPAQMLELATTQIGTEFRGQTQLAAHRWIAQEDGVPVGYVDAGVFDRWTTCDRAPGGAVVVVHTIHRPAAGIGYVVAPQHRGRGVGRAMIEALLHEPAMAGVAVIAAGVEPTNVASIRCLQSAGFTLRNAEPDWEGMLYLLVERD